MSRQPNKPHIKNQTVLKISIGGKWEKICKKMDVTSKKGCKQSKRKKG